MLGFDNPAVSLGRWDPAWSPPGADLPACPDSQEHGPTGRQRWLFTSQQMRLSLVEMGVYESHLAEAEATDEDWGGWNFS